MRTRTHTDAEDFLEHTQVDVEAREAANSLMLGICGRLVRCPDGYGSLPCLKTVQGENSVVLAALMTPPHNLLVYGHRGDLGPGAKLLVEELASEGWRVPGVLGPSEAATTVADAWAEVTGRRCELVQRQRVHKLREVKIPVPDHGRMRLATLADIDLVAAWSYGFHMAIFGQGNREDARRAARSQIEEERAYLWDEGRPVSIAVSTRPTRHGVSVGMAYTPPELRRRGYATACVGELSRLLLGAGWEFCSLFADVENAAANRVYQKIGYVPVCEYEEYRFANEA